MTNRLAACLFFLLFTHALFAQAFLGFVRSRSGEPVQGATIIWKAADSTTSIRYAVTDAKGFFRIALDSPARGFLVFRHVSFMPRTVLLDSVSLTDTAVIFLDEGKQALQEVVVKAQVPVLVRNDTVVYRADAFAGPGVRKVEDLLGRMQGFQVSPDGRITYNGRPVEKVMVDGDDLAGKGYQLLTKNLSAGYVDKVEVITDYSPNRLLGQLRRQEGVGVNLKIRERFRDRINAGAEAAFSGSRYRGNLNALSLAMHRKWFAFGEANNTADDVLGSLGNISEGQGFAEGSASGLMGTARVPVPPISERYSRNNRDAAAVVMAAWKAGRYNRLRMLLGHLDQGLRNEARTLVRTRISDSMSWGVLNEQMDRYRLKGTFIKLTGQRDDSAGKVDEYFLDLRVEAPGSRFSDLASMDIMDSLREQMAGRRVFVGVGWKATRVSGPGRLFQWNTDCSFLHSAEDLVSTTSRYAGYYGLNHGFDASEQGIGLSRVRVVTEASWLKGARQSGWQFGMAGFFERTLLATVTRLSAVYRDTGYSGAGSLSSAAASLKMTRNTQIGKRGELGFNASLGPRLAGETDRPIMFVGYDIAVQYIKRFSALRSFRAKAQAVREAPDLSMAVPAPVLLGNASILEGMDLAGPVTSNALQFSYYVNDLRKQMNWSASLNLTQGPRSYTAATWLQPEYSVARYQLHGGSRALFFMTGAEKFMAALKSKLGLSLVVTGSDSEFLLNGKSTAGRNASLQGEAWWISGFQGGFGLETRVRTGKYFSTLRGEEGRSVLRSGFSQKLQWRKDNFFMSAIWSAVQSGSRDWFHGLDLFLQQRLGEAWTIHLKAINLLGVKVAREQTILPYSSSLNEFVVVPRYLLFGLSVQLK